MTWLRKETIGSCDLYLGDAMAIMPELPLADLVVSDVPYPLISGGGGEPKSGHQKMVGIFSSANYPNDGQLVSAMVPFLDMLRGLYAALATDADCYVMANDKNVHPIMDAAFGAGFSLHNLLVWDKIQPTANRWYMKNCEFTIYLWKGRARTINYPGSKQLIAGGIEKATGHPTEKPVHLMAEYVRNSSQRGDLVLDPFMGSGTTGVACVQLGRRFVGIELDETFFDMACQRIRDAIERPDMWAAHVEPKQEAFI
jgi:DNA modification methylase